MGFEQRCCRIIIRDLSSVVVEGLQKAADCFAPNGRQKKDIGQRW
jgi:hypothetical protein